MFLGTEQMDHHLCSSYKYVYDYANLYVFKRAN